MSINPEGCLTELDDKVTFCLKHTRVAVGGGGGSGGELMVPHHGGVSGSGEWTCSFTHSEPQHQTEGGHQFHAPNTLCENLTTRRLILHVMSPSTQVYLPLYYIIFYQWKTTFHQTDKDNKFIKWITINLANKISQSEAIPVTGHGGL
jgi:hypothetical protein